MKTHIAFWAIVLTAVSIMACSKSDEPAYWMKKYPGADVAKQSGCMALAEKAYQAKGGSQGMGDNGASVLAMGTAWEKCMEGK